MSPARFLPLPLPIALLAAGCAGGLQHPSFIEDLQVVALISEIPELELDEEIDVSAYIADPKDRGAEVMMWTCTTIEEGQSCLEGSQMKATNWVYQLPVVDGIAQLRREIPAWFRNAYNDFTESEQAEAYSGTFPVPLWVLACEPGLCPIFDRVREEQAAIQAASDRNDESLRYFSADLRRDLSEPQGWMVDMPFHGVSLGVRLLQINLGGEPNTNPTYEARFNEADDEVLRIPRNGEQLLAFWVDDEQENQSIYAYGYTTIGRFEELQVKVLDHVVRHYLLAPDRAGSGELYVVFEDENGGSAVYRRRVEIY